MATIRAQGSPLNSTTFTGRSIGRGLPRPVPPPRVWCRSRLGGGPAPVDPAWLFPQGRCRTHRRVVASPDPPFVSCATPTAITFLDAPGYRLIYVGKPRAIGRPTSAVRLLSPQWRASRLPRTVVKPRLPLWLNWRFRPTPLTRCPSRRPRRSYPGVGRHDPTGWNWQRNWTRSPSASLRTDPYREAVVVARETPREETRGGSLVPNRKW